MVSAGRTVPVVGNARGQQGARMRGAHFRQDFRWVTKSKFRGRGKKRRGEQGLWVHSMEMATQVGATSTVGVMLGLAASL